MNKFLYSLFFVLLFASCKEEKLGSYPPIWKGILIEPTKGHVGEEVTFTAVQAEKGHLLNGTDYNFSLQIQVYENGNIKDTVLTHHYHTNYDGKDNSDPKWTVKIPEHAVAKGNNKFYFKGHFSNSTYPETEFYGIILDRDPNYKGVIELNAPLGIYSESKISVNNFEILPKQ